MKIGIIGAGSWGTALAVSSARAGNDVALWAFDDELAKNMQKGRENDLIPGVKIPENVFITGEMADLRGTQAWLVATPSEFFSETMQKGREFWVDQPVIICTKGMTADGKFMSEVLTDAIPEILPSRIGILSGPQFAGEVARGEPTGSTIAGGPEILAAARVALSEFVLEETDDTIGVQVCGAGKNAIAILIGYIDGSGAGENERALKLTESWGEIVRLGRYLGARTETFLGLAGMGDLFLSADSKTSRNYSAGLALSRGEKPNGTIEGVSAIRGLSKIAQKAGISTPNLSLMAGLI